MFYRFNTKGGTAVMMNTWRVDNTEDMFRVVERLKVKYTDVRFTIWNDGGTGWVVKWG